MGEGVGQGVLLSLEPVVLVGLLDAGGVELLVLEAQQVELAGTLALVAAEGAELLVERGQLLAQRPQGLEIDAPEAVEGAALAGRRQQRLVIVLAVQVDQACPRFGQLGHRGETAVHVGTRATLAGHDPAQDDLFIAEHEPALDDRLVGARAHDGRIGAATDQQLDGLDDHRLAGAGLTGHGGHAGGQHQREPVDDPEVGHHEFREHAFSLPEGAAPVVAPRTFVRMAGTTGRSVRTSP